MKCVWQNAIELKLFLVIAVQLIIELSAFAQITPPAPPASSLPSTTTPAANPPAGTPAGPSAQGAPALIEPPATQTPSTQPTPKAKEAIPWNVQILKDDLVSLSQSSEFKLPSKIDAKKRLSSPQLAAIKLKIAQSSKDVKNRIRLAGHLESVGDFTQVIETLQPIAGIMPKSGVFQLSNAYLHKKRFADAIKLLEMAASKNSTDAVVQFELGRAYSIHDRSDEAIARFQKARELRPRYLPPYEALLREAIRAGYLHDAMQVAQDIQKNFGDKAKILGDLCLLYAHDAYLEKAAEICMAAVQKAPKTPPYHVYYGLVVRELDGPEAANKILSKTANQFKKSELAQYAAGEINYERKNFIASMRYFANGVKITPNSARSQLGLARAAFQENKFEIALTAFQKACSLNRLLVFDLRKASSILRIQKKDVLWANRFDAAVDRCEQR